MNANEIALAFNQQNPRKTWSARPTNTTVHFSTGVGLIALVYDTTDGTFQVRFNKYTAAWGDYVKAIARTLQVVLSTLQSAGLPFEAPADVEGIDIVTTIGKEGAVYVRFDPPAPARSVAHELAQYTPAQIANVNAFMSHMMPELRTPGILKETALALGQLPIHVNPELPDSIIQFVDPETGKEVGRIENLGEPTGTIGGAEITGDDG